MSTSPLIYYSNSGVQEDWTCPRSRYWGHEYQGVGLQTGETSLEYLIGQVLHDGLAAIARDVPIDDIAGAAFQQIRGTLLDQMGGEMDADIFASEQATLTEGMLRGYHKHVWPRFRQQFPTLVGHEKELIYTHDEIFRFMAKPDLLPRDVEGNLWYVEYKSTSSKKEEWINSWSTAVQLHSSVRAVEQLLGEKVMGVIVQGFYKGYVSYGKQTSPFCYGYYSPANPPFTQARWSYEYKQGLKKYPIWERPGGVKAWIDGMPEGMLAEQFPQTPPIFLKEHLIDAFFRQRVVREREIYQGSSELRDPHTASYMGSRILDAVFPQRFNQCIPSFGRPCKFRKLCHGPEGVDPLASGFVLRDTSHRAAWIGEEPVHEEG